MPSILDQAKDFFGTTNLYELFCVEKTALEKDITKSYYKIALKVHPDRVEETEKEAATEKFKVLAKLHQVLTDKEKRKLYDEQGIVGEDDDESFGASWLETWNQFFKPISEEQINSYEKQYIDSELERADIRRAYLNGKGCIDFMFNMVPFMTIESEPRIIGIVKSMIVTGELPEYKSFVEEPKNKTAKRHMKYKREEKEAEKVKADMNQTNLEKMIMHRQVERNNGFASFLDKLAEKYAGEDDESEEYFPSKNSTKRKSARATNQSNFKKSKK